jgi:hypothetical protein
MRTRLLIAGAAVGLLLWISPAGAGVVEPFTIDPLELTLAPGDSFTVTGSGCPSTGAFPTSAPVHLRLTPPTGGNGWGPGMIGEQITVFSSSAYFAGETDVTTVPAEDGTFSATVVVPADAPGGEGYSVRGYCVTLVEPGDGPNGFDPDSVAAGYAEAGTLSVVRVSDPLTTAPDTTAGPDPDVQPRFTG